MNVYVDIWMNGSGRENACIVENIIIFIFLIQVMISTLTRLDHVLI